MTPPFTASVLSLSSGPEDAGKETNVWGESVWADGRDLYDGRT